MWAGARVAPEELVQELFALEKRLKICKQRSATGKVTKRSVLNRKWAVWRETTGYIPRSPPKTPPDPASPLFPARPRHC